MTREEVISKKTLTTTETAPLTNTGASRHTRKRCQTKCSVSADVTCVSSGVRIKAGRISIARAWRL